MLRALKLVWPLVVLLLATCAVPALAQDWPTVKLSSSGEAHAFDRGPGFYLSIPKLVISILVFVLWVRTTDWVSLDCVALRQNFVKWNALVVGVFVAGFLLHLLIPIYAVGVILLLAAYGGPLGAYVSLRNKLVEENQRVLTKQHTRQVISRLAQKVGLKVEEEETLPQDMGAKVEFKAQGAASEQDNNVNLLTARQLPGFVAAKDLVDDVIARDALAVMLDYTREAVALRYQIDGVWHNGESREREPGDQMLAVFKTLAACKPAERRAKQEGKFQAEARGRKLTAHLLSQGTPTGERVLLKLSDNKQYLKSFEELGMREKLREQLQELLDMPDGFILLSAPPGGGLSSLFNATLEECDRLLRNFVGVEEVSRREREIENVDMTTYDAAAGETPLSVLPKMIRQYPDVIVSRELPDAETVELLCQQAGEKRLMFGGVYAKEAPEALLRVLMLKVPATTFAPVVKLVVNMRLVRKLCPECKIAFPPTPEMLQKLGIPPGRVEALYREPTPADLEEKKQKEPCQACGGLGYKGRTGIFEVLVVDDKVREVLIKQPKLELLKKAARLAGMRSLQEEGILLVAQGVTSVPELMRALKA